VLVAFGPYGIIFMTMCFVITGSMVMLVTNFGPYEVMFGAGLAQSV
jgi:hypothetical protein